MKKLLFIILLILLSFDGFAKKNLADYVNTLQGTDSKFELSRGNTFPTTTMPWGMNFWTPQTGRNGNGWIYQYTADSIRGFRQSHQCSPWTNDFAAISLMPVSGTLRVNQYDRANKFKHENEIARPYYYAVTFDDNVKAEMSPTDRGAFMRFSYPKGKDSYVVFDGYRDGSMVKIFPKERKVVGYTKNVNKRYAPSNFTNYFVIYFDQDFESFGTWTTEAGLINERNTEATADNAGAYFKFKPGAVVNAKIISSFISQEQAERNYKFELASATKLEDVKASALSTWNKQLGKVEVEGGTEELKETFYSCFFRSMLFPIKFYEYDAQHKPIYYSPYDGKIHAGRMYTNTGFWDTFRAQFPLNALLHPQYHGYYIKSILDAYDQSDWLPSWSFPGHGGGMIGNHAFSLLQDAYVKGFKFDTKKALAAMYHDANNKGPTGPSIGRNASKDYFKLGYVPLDESRESTAQTLEFAYDDWCAMTLAKETGDKANEKFFAQSIFNYKNVFDPSVGFMRGRMKDGSWTPNFDPTEWGGAFTEGNSWHWTWSVMHDIQGLIDLIGGDQKFVDKLDSVFTEPNTVKVGSYGHMIHEMTEMVMIKMGQYAHGNQPIQHMPYLYTYVGQPWKTQYWTRKVMADLYNAGPDGFCGDEDEGQTSSWYVISAMGLYSVCPGTDQYVIGSPIFPKMTIHLENGKTLVIDAKNNSDKNVYIKSASFNGKPFTRNWLTYSQLENGGVIRYEMSDQINKTRGITKADRPYSYSVK